MNKIFEKQENFIDKKAISLMRISRIISISILYLIQIAITIFIYIKSDYKYKNILYYLILGFAILLLYIIYVFWKTKLEQKNYSYTIGNYGITIQRGVIKKEKSYIPYNTIQNVDIEQGIIMRKYNFSNIKISAINHVETIKFVKTEFSDQLKQKIVENKNKYKYKY